MEETLINKIKRLLHDKAFECETYRDMEKWDCFYRKGFKLGIFELESPNFTEEELKQECKRIYCMTEYKIAKKGK